ncbi:unnamed protein product [Mucor circinelloides]
MVLILFSFVVDKYHQHHNIYFSRSNNPHHVDLFMGKQHRKRQNYTSIIRCYDYQCIEAIQTRLKQAPDAAFTVLLGAILRVDSSIFSIVDKPVTLFVLLDADSYVRRSFTVNMSWCRRLWSLASRAHMISVTGVYYSVLGGAYCSLGKSNSKYVSSPLVCIYIYIHIYLTNNLTNGLKPGLQGWCFSN